MDGLVYYKPKDVVKGIVKLARHKGIIKLARHKGIAKLACLYTTDLKSLVILPSISVVCSINIYHLQSVILQSIL